jgi:hypothetical protein
MLKSKKPLKNIFSFLIPNPLVQSPQLRANLLQIRKSQQKQNTAHSKQHPKEFEQKPADSDLDLYFLFLHELQLVLVERGVVALRRRLRRELLRHRGHRWDLVF